MRLIVLFAWFVSVIAGSAVASAATETAAEAPAPTRLAIVIGNSDYESSRYEDLANAGNDAERLAEALRRLRFEVAVGTNLSAAATEELLRRYETRLGEYGAVLFFYAGHGVQFNGENYLLPVDSDDPTSADALTAKALRLNEVITRFGSRDRQTFIFLDACRNNPLAGAAPGVGAGLAQVEVGENSFVAFSTQPGNVTVDGTGINSPFTSALLQNLEMPGQSISDMMIRVRNETERLTVGRQVPWDQSNLREQFYFTEDQDLDQRQLSETLNRILEVPAMKDKLLIQLASADSDLQSTVLMLGRQLPSVSRSVGVDATEPGQQLASLSAPDSVSRDVVRSDIETLLVLGKPQEGGETGPTIAHRVQTELARVGCYRMAVDGDWGPGSKRALGEYLRRTKQEQASLDPTVDVLSDLFLRSGRICREPVRVTKTATLEGGQKRQQTNRAASSGQKKAQPPAQRSQTRRPAAPPPDIGAGIGIGGIF